MQLFGNVATCPTSGEKRPSTGRNLCPHQRNPFQLQVKETTSENALESIRSWKGQTLNSLKKSSEKHIAFALA
jgi:hypothetical protein